MLRCTVQGFDRRSLCAEDDTLSGGLFPPGFNDWQNAKPPMAIKNAGFCKAMFDMYIDDKTVVKPTRAIWAKSIAALPSQ